MREKNKRKTTIEKKNSNDVENCNHNAHLPTGFKAHYYVSMHVGVSGKLASFITAGNISLDTRTHISNAKRKITISRVSLHAGGLADFLKKSVPLFESKHTTNRHSFKDIITNKTQKRIHNKSEIVNLSSRCVMAFYYKKEKKQRERETKNWFEFVIRFSFKAHLCR